jgi:hypothetical protein
VTALRVAPEDPLRHHAAAAVRDAHEENVHGAMDVTRR